MQFLELASRHWGSLLELMPAATMMTGTLTEAASMAMKAYSMPRWHLTANAMQEVTGAGIVDAR